jgi:hypothetical protein
MLLAGLVLVQMWRGTPAGEPPAAAAVLLGGAAAARRQRRRLDLHRDGAPAVAGLRDPQDRGRHQPRRERLEVAGTLIGSTLIYALLGSWLCACSCASAVRPAHPTGDADPWLSPVPSTATDPDETGREPVLVD